MTLISLPAGPFTRADARDVGLSPAQIAELVRCRTIRRVLRNVYVACDVPDTVEVRAAAAALAVVPGAVFVDRTAAWLHGVDVFDYRELEVLPPVECVVLRDRSRIERPECVGGERDLAPLRRDAGARAAGDHAAAHGARPRVRPAATGRPGGARHVRAGARRHPRRAGGLVGAVPAASRCRPAPIARAPGRRAGRVRARVPHAARDHRCRAARAPVPQHWVEEHGVPLFRLDLAYPRHRVAVEYDGAEWHDRTDEQRDADRLRRRWLADNGWTVIVVRRGDFAPGRRTRWLGELRAALRTR